MIGFLFGASAEGIGGVVFRIHAGEKVSVSCEKAMCVAYISFFGADGQLSLSRAVETPPRPRAKWTSFNGPADPMQRKAWCGFAGGFQGHSDDGI